MSDDPLTHFDGSGAARMVPVEDKPETLRTAVATAQIRMNPTTLERIHAGKIGKGDVLAVARVAGVAAAKQSAALIPLCHPVRITSVDIELRPDPELPGIVVIATVRAIDRTGPEMEALAAATIAALTIYDMCKAMDRAMAIDEVMLLEKSGGKSGTWKRG